MTAAARFQRSAGTIALVVVDRGGRPAIARSFQSGSARLRFPRVARGVDALVLNTSGGLASGDVFRIEVTAGAHALTVSTPACERVYRCEGPPAEMMQALQVAPGASLRHVPQPTILFDGSRLVRRTRVAVAEGGRMTLCEGLVLGRAAMGETVRSVDVRDLIEVVIGDRLAFVDALRLTDEVLARSWSPALLGGARGIGLVVDVGALDGAVVARAALDGADAVCGATHVNGVTVVRVLAKTHANLQDALGRAAAALSGTPMPRAWQL